ncbi:protein HEAT INTOLERANT 4-like [Bidens hawaiensis]|uniref:protein HEAT INTOLERANT 4-like n=1 Tax=Bidens hawaiensis TaxID=980011 RepID=UPI00404A3E0A
MGFFKEICVCVRERERQAVVVVGSGCSVGGSPEMSYGGGRVPNNNNNQDAFKEGGLLHGKENVYLFTVGESQGLTLDGRPTKTYAPVVIAIVSPFPPSDKMAIIPVDEGLPSAKVIDMEKMNMAWVPCSIPLRQRGDTPPPQISVISYVQNMDTSDIGIELGPDSHICLPYFDNLSKAKQSTAVDIVYPAEGEPIVVDRFDWKVTWRETFIDGLIDKGKLSIDHKDAFKAILALEDLSRTDEKVAAFENMRFYKFYPDFAVFQA